MIFWLALAGLAAGYLVLEARTRGEGSWLYAAGETAWRIITWRL